MPSLVPYVGAFGFGLISLAMCVETVDSYQHHMYWKESAWLSVMALAVVVVILISI